MRTLPPRILPPRKPTIRRHVPPPAKRWSDYRSCLRWDFGFVCPFCLLHEADLYGGQLGEGLGGTTVEHRVPRSADPARENEYANCLYACRFCNRSRSVSPIRTSGARLLDPTEDPWGDHFEAEDDHLKPVAGDPDADYTHRAYDFDDPRKVARRRARRELVNDRLALLSDLGSELVVLLGLAEGLRRRDFQKFGWALQEIQKIRSAALRALEDLKRYPAIPADAPARCRCQGTDLLSLPAELERQTLEVPDAF